MSDKTTKAKPRFPNKEKLVQAIEAEIAKNKTATDWIGVSEKNRVNRNNLKDKTTIPNLELLLVLLESKS